MQNVQLKVFLKKSTDSYLCYLQCTVRTPLVRYHAGSIKKTRHLIRSVL